MLTKCQMVTERSSQICGIFLCMAECYLACRHAIALLLPDALSQGVHFKRDIIVL